MAINFPDSPSTDDIFTSGGRSWTCTGSTWQAFVQAMSNGSITNDLIANTTITAAKIANTTITDAQIANAAVTSAKIANANITSEHIANTTITSAHIANATITNTQLAANVAVTNLGFTPASTGKAIAMSIVFGG